ncbi:class I SAM-dependent methyltransferase [Pseudonocardia xinjiangensis]|uniref:class I SAM-dependent methyltransferase n=1 Tax=Pseudonocardia xinjiangensis TaxID=75289 RepID=UPI003D905049
MTNSATIPAGVGWTALMTAYARAQETRRADRLFEDPYAVNYIAALTSGTVPGRDTLPRVGPARDDGSSALWSLLTAYFAGRTPFFDNQVRAGVAAGAVQVCILAAGLDSRAQRDR